MSDSSEHKFYHVRYRRSFQSVEHATVRVSAEDVMDAIAIAKEQYGTPGGGIHGLLEWKEDADEFEPISCEVTAIGPDGKPVVAVMEV